MPVLEKIEQTISTLEVKSISGERKVILQPLIDFIQTKVNERKAIRLHFICTHNSRRSHLAQVWAQVMAHHFNISKVSCYSGGTEATALYPMVITTLKAQGCQIQTLSEGNNPIYAIKYGENEIPIIGFSKTYEDDFNPITAFAAILTCSEADTNCPFIAGAEKRIPIPYEDPKAFDDTPQKEDKYKERSEQIATELFYVFSQINS